MFGAKNNYLFFLNTAIPDVPFEVELHGDARIPATEEVDSECHDVGRYRVLYQVLVGLFRSPLPPINLAWCNVSRELCVL